MKINKYLLAALAATSLMTGAAQAQVELTITGSTAFRSGVFDRLSTSGVIFDAGFSDTGGGSGANARTFSGTMTGKIPSLGSTVVTVYTSFSGSGSGMLAVKNSTSVTCSNVTGTATVTKTPDVAFSDVFPGSASPAIPDASFDQDVVAIVPFVFAANNSVYNDGIHNITRDQALLLMTASGSIGGFPGMPHTFLGGSTTNAVYLVGRDSGSGTRISIERDINFVGSPSLWQTDANGAAGTLIASAGYASGGTVGSCVANNADTIGYLGIADFTSKLLTPAKGNKLTYNGVAHSDANVENGSYALWGYEHVVNRAGALSANQQLVWNVIKAACQDDTWQHTVTYTGNFVPLADMQVERGTDGGTITSLNF